MFCTECGKQLKENQKFCTNCGASTEGASLPAAASQAAVLTPSQAASGQVPSRSSPVLAANRAPSDDIPRPIPVGPTRPAKSQAGRQQSNRIPSSTSSSRQLLMWGGGSLLVLAAAVTVFLYLRNGDRVTITDAEIEKSIQAKFASDPHLSKYPFTIRSQKGVVTLLGSVNNNSDRSTAAHIILQQHGVKTFVDDLVVSTTAAASSLIIAGP